MAYVSYPQSASEHARSKTAAPRIAWARLAVFLACAAFWVGLAVALRAAF